MTATQLYRGLGATELEAQLDTAFYTPVRSWHKNGNVQTVLSRSQLQYTYYSNKVIPNAVVEWLPLLPHIRDVSDSNFGPEDCYSDRDIS
jgi:hypothetical protein